MEKSGGDNDIRRLIQYNGYWIQAMVFTGVCIGLTAFALAGWGAREVRADFREVFLLAMLGFLWVSLSSALFSWLGLSLRQDVCERGNRAALFSLCGARLGIALTYAAGNLGEGPSYVENFFSAGLATGGLGGLWLLLEAGANVSGSIAEERDLASGLRLGGFLAAAGLILGRAVTGNWHSAPATIDDFARDGWYALILLAAALAMEFWLRPSRARPFPDPIVCGAAPALAYLGFAALCLWHLGTWEGMPR